MLIHRDDLAGMMHGDWQLLPALIAIQDLHDLLFVTYQNDFTTILLCRTDRTENNLFRCEISAHGINCYFQLESPLYYSAHEIPRRITGLDFHLRRCRQLA